MNLTQLLENVADQDKGAELNLPDPVTGEPTGMKLWLVGPDSDTARRAEIAMADDLAEMADDRGMVNGEQRAKARLQALARLVVRWEVADDDGPVAFNQKNLITLLRVSWVRQTVEGFAADRANFMAAR